LNTDSTETTLLEGGQQQAATIHNDFAIRITAGKPKADGEQEFSLRYERYMIDVAGVLKFDSADPEAEGQDPNLALVGRTLLGMNIVVILDGKGEVKSMTGSDEAWDKLAGENPGNPWIGQIKQMLGLEFYRSLLRPGKGVLPDNPVAVGEEWETSLDEKLPAIGPVEITYDCVFKRLEKRREDGETALIEFTGGFKIPEGREMTLANGIPATVQSGEYAFEGATRCDAERKLIVEGMNRVRGGMKMTLSMPDGRLMPIETKQEVLSQLTLEGVENPAP